MCKIEDDLSNLQKRDRLSVVNEVTKTNKSYIFNTVDRDHTILGLKNKSKLSNSV